MTVIDKFDGLKSLDPMSEQAEVVSSIIQDVMRQNPDGIHLLCYSQGDNLCIMLMFSNTFLMWEL